MVENDDPGAQLALYELAALSIRTPELRGLAREQFQMYWDAAGRATRPWLEATGADLPGGHEVLARLVATVFDA